MTNDASPKQIAKQDSSYEGDILECEIIAEGIAVGGLHHFSTKEMKSDTQIRITSYNVCYTKLLRGVGGIRRLAEIARGDLGLEETRAVRLGRQYRREVVRNNFV